MTTPRVGDVVVVPGVKDEARVKSTATDPFFPQGLICTIEYPTKLERYYSSVLRIVRRPLAVGDEILSPHGEVRVAGLIDVNEAADYRREGWIHHPSGLPIDAPEVVLSKIVKFTQTTTERPTGFNCRQCNSRNDYAHANQSDGTYVCFECRR